MGHIFLNHEVNRGISSLRTFDIRVRARGAQPLSTNTRGTFVFFILKASRCKRLPTNAKALEKRPVFSLRSPHETADHIRYIGSENRPEPAVSSALTREILRPRQLVFFTSEGRLVHQLQDSSYAGFRGYKTSKLL